MKLLLDENLPKRLKSDFPSHTVFTVADMGWQGKKNGELMELLTIDGFDVFITYDKNLKFQQNLSRLQIVVIQLMAPDNTYLSTNKLIPAVHAFLESVPTKGLYVVT